jgi:frataxin-like iron-binding protein CyaY
VAEWRVAKLGDVEGVLQITAGPDSAEALSRADPEELWLATEGSGRRAATWRGAFVHNGQKRMAILSFSSPIETFPDARGLYDAMLAHVAVHAA